mgnify:CR=1 FL=1
MIQLRTYSPALKTATLAIAALAIFLTLAIWIIYNGRANADEGFYALASKLAISGEIPYRDFAYTQMPLLPYIQGAFLHWFEFTVEAQRWLNVFWSSCLLGMIAWRLHRSGAAQREWASTLCLWLTAIPIVYFSIIGKTYGLAQLLLVIAALGLWLTDPRRSLCHIALFGVLAIGCRLTVAPAVAAIYLYPTIRILRQKTGLLWVLIPPLFFASALLCPFFLLAPDNTYFWTWQYHILSTLPKRPIIQVFGEFTVMAPGLLLVACYSLWYGIKSKSTGKHSTHYLFCLGAGLFGAAVNIITTSFYAEYAVMFTPLILLGAGGLITQESAPRELAPKQMILLAGCALSLAIFCLSNKDRYIRPGYIESVKAAGAHLAQCTAPNALVITSMPEILLQADRQGHRQLAMGCFSVTGDMPENQATTLGMMHINQLLRELYQGSADALVLWNGANFEYSAPSMCYFTKETHKLTAETIKRNYEPSFSNRYFTVLVRKPTSSVP